MSAKVARIEIEKQALNFSAAHFTIFDQTEREDLHGHNFQVVCHMTGPVGEDGLMFDYALIKRALKNLCDSIDEKTLLPAHSPFLGIEETDDMIIAHYGDERIPFLKRDVLVLPIANTTVEEFSHYFLNQILAMPDFEDKGVTALTVKVSSSPGQQGCAEWELA